MSKSKKITAGILCLALTLGITGCEQSGSNPKPPSTSETEEDYTVDIGDITLDLEENKNIEGAVVNYIGTYNPTKAGDIKPAYTYFTETYKATLEVDLYADSEIMEKLAVLINGGESPDLVDQRDNSFPYYIGKNTYMALDDYMDLNAPQWADVVDYINNYAINGKHYYYPWAYYVSPRILIYNRGKFAELGLSDPKELYDKNEWTWDTFYSCMEQFVSKSKAEVPDAIGLYGSVATSFIDTTGTPLIDMKDGQLINNLNNANVDRAQSFLENLKKQEISKLYYGEYNNVDHDPILNGYAAFHSVGDWKITDYSKKQAKNPDLDIMFVPFPKDPNADKYYLGMNTMAYLVPAGAKDVEAACVFINCVRLSKTDPELKKTVDESIMKEKKYTDEQYELWSYLQDVSNFKMENLVYDFGYHVDEQTCTDVINKLCEDTPFVQNEDTKTWTAMRESFGPMLESSIEAINSELKQ